MTTYLPDKNVLPASKERKITVLLDFLKRRCTEELKERSDSKKNNETINAQCSREFYTSYIFSVCIELNKIRKRIFYLLCFLRMLNEGIFIPIVQ